MGKDSAVGQISAHIGAAVRRKFWRQRLHYAYSQLDCSHSNVLAKRPAAVRIDPSARASDALAPQARLFARLTSTYG